MIKNLVFEGGGVKGIAFCGAIRVLEEKKMLSNVKNYIGSSAGAIMALMLSIGLTSIEIEDILKTMDYDKFLDLRWGVLNKLYYFISKYGIHKGEYLLKFVGQLLEKQTGNKNITFQELHHKYGNNLVITGTNIDAGIVEYFSHTSYPNMPVKIAIRISMSIPFLFEAVRYDGNLYVDGGILNNYPFNYFTDYENTIGFKLVGSDEKRDSIIKHYNNEIANIKDFSINLIDSLLNQIERLYINDEYWKRTITINTLGVNTTDVNLTDEQKNLLILEGYKCTMDFFKSIPKDL
jgi:NTE family protein